MLGDVVAVSSDVSFADVARFVSVCCLLSLQLLKDMKNLLYACTYTKCLDLDTVMNKTIITQAYTSPLRSTRYVSHDSSLGHFLVR